MEAVEHGELLGGQLVRLVATSALHTLSCVRIGTAFFGLRRLTSRARREPEASARIQNEARILELLAGRAAPMLARSGEDEHGPFVLYEWVEGEVISTSTSTSTPTPTPTSTSPLSFARRAFAALARVHESLGANLRVAHGDVRPENIVLRDRDAVFVDFALARALSPSGEPARLDSSDVRNPVAAREVAFSGTALYAAPEVARGESPTSARDAQSADVFALGMCILHISRGAPPRRGQSLPMLLLEAGSEEPRLPTPRSTTETQLYEAIAPCLRMTPELRPAASEVADVLFIRVLVDFA